jgi:hypothetical protein
MGFFNKKATPSKKQEEAEAKAAPLTPDKSSDEEQSDEVLEGDQEEGGFSKLWESLSGMCGNSDDANDEWCNMKEGMAEI